MNATTSKRIISLKQQLDACTPGRKDCQKWQKLCADTVEFLFVPDLSVPQRQAKTSLGGKVFDLLLSNRNISSGLSKNDNWFLLYKETAARYIVFEFKNYAINIGNNELRQVASYLQDNIGNLAIIVCNQPPSKNAIKRRDELFIGHNKFILFLSKEDLKVMLDMKAVGKDPSGFIVDLWDTVRPRNT